MNTIEKITILNLKNASQEYSLGDVLLLSKYEKDLKAIGWTKEQIEGISPNYYNEITEKKL